MKITQGVNVHVHSSQKFKTIRLSMFFRAPLSAESMTKRVLLAQLLETNSKDYPTQTDMNHVLSDLYGLSFTTTTSSIGDEHVVVLNFNMPDPRYLTTDESYLQHVFDFVRSVTFRPNIEKGSFHEQTFQRERTDLKEYVLSRRDDKTFETLESLLSMTFTNPAKQVLTGVHLDRLEALTAKDVADAYEDMVANDNVDIIVFGDIEEKVIEDFAKSLTFEARDSRKAITFSTDDVVDMPLNKVDNRASAQTKIAQAYKVPIRRDSEQYEAGLIFNSLFGGDMHSKLFQNVREKESLAYNISSMLMIDSGLMLVFAGIDSQTIDKAKNIIAEQLNAMVAGDFNEEELNQSKAILTHNLKSQADNVSRTTAKIYQNILLERPTPDLEESIQKINAVTKDDVVAIAKDVSLQTEFILQGN